MLFFTENDWKRKNIESNGTASGYKGLGETFDIDFDKIITRDCPWKM